LKLDFSAGWRPDLGENLGGHLVEALNVTPAEDGLEALLDFLPGSDALPGAARPLGSLGMRTISGDGLFFIAVSNAIYRLSGTAWADVSPVAGVSVGADDIVGMTRYDQGAIYSNFQDPMQVRIDGTDTLFRRLISLTDPDNYLTGVVPGSPADNDPNLYAPKAKHIATIANHLVGGFTNDNQSGIVPSRVVWSRLGEPTKFLPNLDFLANFNDLSAAGEIRRVVNSGEYGVIFQETSVSRMDPGNPVQGFDIREADQSRGALMSGGVIPFGRTIGFIAEDGFQIFDGQKSEPIGVGQVDRTFRRLYNNDHARFVTGTVDRRNKTMIWSLPLGTGDNAPNRLFFYNLMYKQWTEAEGFLFRVFNVETGGAVTDSEPFASSLTDTGIFADTPVDSPQFAGSSLKLGAIDAQGRLVFNTGEALRATIETSDVELIEGRRTKLLSSRPTYRGAPDIRMRYAARPFVDVANLTFGPESAVNNNGECPGIATGRYHRFKLEAPPGHKVDRFHGLHVEDQWIQDVGLR
jgi:hypothetical protein